MFNLTYNQIIQLVKFTNKKYTCHSSPKLIVKMYMSTNKKWFVCQLEPFEKSWIIITNQDFGFVAQMFVATNVIPFESIQFQTLENINPSSKIAERCWCHSTLDLYDEKWLAMGK